MNGRLLFPAFPPTSVAPPCPWRARTLCYELTCLMLRGLVSIVTYPRTFRHEPTMTIARAANAVAPTLRAVAPYPEAIIIITMPVIIIAELDIRISALAINNAEQPISVSRFDTHFPTLFKCKCKSVDCAAVGWYAPPATLTELLLMAISNISPISTSPKQRGIVPMR